MVCFEPLLFSGHCNNQEEIGRWSEGQNETNIKQPQETEYAAACRSEIRGSLKSRNGEAASSKAAPCMIYRIDNGKALGSLQIASNHNAEINEICKTTDKTNAMPAQSEITQHVVPFMALFSRCACCGT
jgi:hypothetical protein